MAKVYVFLANGFEEVEAMSPVDVFRRAGIEVVTVSITGSEFVKGAHNVIIKADKVFAECKFDDADLLVLPGGMPGATNLNEHQGLRNLLIEHNLRLVVYIARKFENTGVGIEDLCRSACSRRLGIAQGQEGDMLSRI